MKILIFSIFLLVANTFLCHADDGNDDDVNNVYSNSTSSTTSKIPESFYLNNSLWTQLVKNCKQLPTFKCIEDVMYDYLSDTLEYPDNFELINFIKFKKNSVNYNLISSSSDKNNTIDNNSTTTMDNKIEDNNKENFNLSGLERISRSLNDKTIKFLMTHDVEFQLPESFFEGTILKIAPRTFDEGGGALLKVDFQPKSQIEEARIFKKIKKFITEKLVFALLAILLVVKLLAAKFLFFMPMVIGAVAAKKLLIKVLLFIFPALKYIFKLCPYVPHATKLHHHKHQISHIHHISGHPLHFGPSHSNHHHPHHNDGIEIIAPHANGPPTLPYHGHHHESLHHYNHHDSSHLPSYNPNDQDFSYHTDGPEFTNDFINHREDPNSNEIHYDQYNAKSKGPYNNLPLTPTEIEAIIRKTEKEAKLKTRLQLQEKLRIQEENYKLQQKLKEALKQHEKLKQQQQQQQILMKPTHKGAFFVTPLPSTQMALFQQTFKGQQQEQQQQLKKGNYHTTSNLPQKQAINPRLDFEIALQKAASITFDPFYSPILEKIDKILTGLGFNDESCKERLICSMYKSPTKFSPHSNLLSVELSRDAKELQKPKITNAAVIRFYKYVQAARDGQNQKECSKLYNNCSAIISD